MEGRTRCAKCSKRGKPCINISWEHLNATKESLQSELSKLMDEQEALQFKISRKRKLLEQALDKSRKKASCLLDELDAEVVAEQQQAVAESCPPDPISTSDFLFGVDWSSVDLDGILEVPAGNS